MTEATHVLARVLQCIGIAQSSGASKLQIFAGQPPRMRVAGQLSEPLQPESFHFNDTQSMVELLLTPDELQTLDKDGSVDITPPFDWHPASSVTVFFGNGCHNLIVHLA